MEKPVKERFNDADNYLEELEKYVCDYVVPNASNNDPWSPEFQDPEFDDFYFGPRIFHYQPFDESQDAPILFDVVNGDHELELEDLNALQLELESYLLHSLKYQRMLKRIVSERERHSYLECINNEITSKPYENEITMQDSGKREREIYYEKYFNKKLKKHRSYLMKKNAKIQQNKAEIKAIICEAKQLKSMLNSSSNHESIINTDNPTSTDGDDDDSQGSKDQYPEYMLESNDDTNLIIPCELFNIKRPAPFVEFENNRLNVDDSDSNSSDSDYEVSSVSSIEDDNFDLGEILRFDMIVNKIYNEDYDKKYYQKKRKSKQQQVNEDLFEPDRIFENKYLNESFCFPDDHEEMLQLQKKNMIQNSDSDNKKQEMIDIEVEENIEKLIETLSKTSTLKIHQKSQQKSQQIQSFIGGKSSKKQYKRSLNDVLELSEKFRLNRQILCLFNDYLLDYSIFNAYHTNDKPDISISMDKLLEAILNENIYEARYVRSKMPDIKKTMLLFKNLIHFNTIPADNQRELDELPELTQSQLDSLLYFDNLIKNIHYDKKPEMALQENSIQLKTYRKIDPLIREYKRLNNFLVKNNDSYKLSDSLSLFGVYTKRLLSCLIDRHDSVGSMSQMKLYRNNIKNELLTKFVNIRKQPDGLLIEKLVQKKLQYYGLLKLPRGNDILNKLQRKAIQLRSDHEKIIRNFINILRRDILSFEFEKLFKQVYKDICEAIDEMEKDKIKQNGLVDCDWPQTLDSLFLMKDPILFQLNILRAN